VGVGVAAVICLRLALPSIIKSHVNDRLADMGPYSGRVADIDVALLRGAYTLNALTIVKDDAGREIPFLELPAMDISVHWRALFSGELVGEIVATSPTLNLVRAESSEQSQLGSGVNWPDQIRELFPFTFNRVTVTDGTATFLAPGIESSESLSVSAIRLELENLTNINESQEETTATIDLQGRFMDQASLVVNGRINPNEDTPTFDIDFSLEGAEVTAANPWLQEFLNVDAESGRFSMYLEAAAADGRFDGYLKPIMEDLEVFDLEAETEGPFRKAWEALVNLGANIFENRAQDQVATRIPYSGEFEDPDIGVLSAIISLIRNAFVSALSQSLEGTIDIGDVAATEDGDETAPEDR
jgi:hypothetical protein